MLFHVAIKKNMVNNFETVNKIFLPTENRLRNFNEVTGKAKI